ncbi:hypothetical protein [Microvirga guangxiensis]|uniref:Lipoprotein n=1 Tax=Microvirga guangxiensis TaxID=549386 RepID=A0A1G5K446_9HYPH|nr:hypothetical protein [Microvirga guangxiensis]SCY95234.1 hypothetical protein SAMN02927923_03055 [Microvirga guangxiensis]
MKRLAASLLLVLPVLALPACAQQTEPKAARQAVQALVPKVLEALAKRDFDRLATFVGDNGLTVSPYVMLDDSDVRLSRPDLQSCVTDREVRLWGERDGSGDPIEITCSQYFDEFVWNADYRQPDEVLYNEPRQRGNEINNNHDYAPDGIVVELHIRGDGDQAAMNWKSLRLIFRDGEKGLSLIAITRDVWTI